MDKHLKEFNFEENINSTFTEENKQNVLGKINDIEKKRNKKQSLFANGLTLAFSVGLLIFGFNFVSNNIEGTKENVAESNDTENELILNQNGEEPTQTIATEDDEKEKEELEVGAYFDYFWSPESLDTHEDYDYSDSNYNLYIAHLRAALITDNAIFLTGRMDYSTYKRYLDSILFYLNEIVPGEEKIEEFQMAVKLAEQAIDNEVEKGDPILDDLHMVLHELDEYYNAEAFQDHITNENGIIVK
ncbi:polyphosphate kinase [Psychrobacillus sp. FSL H8-0510]|uniref:polyphosphate kinase n=1 Tax=Psychrobacillus sp. FSL H8-0510 TaxID=2921394 RepID=UPI0030F83096